MKKQSKYLILETIAEKFDTTPRTIIEVNKKLSTRIERDPKNRKILNTKENLEEYQNYFGSLRIGDPDVDSDYVDLTKVQELFPSRKELLSFISYLDDSNLHKKFYFRNKDIIELYKDRNFIAKREVRFVQNVLPMLESAVGITTCSLNTSKEKVGVNIVEIGASNGYRSKHLLDIFQKHLGERGDFVYFGVDSSKWMIMENLRNVQKHIQEKKYEKNTKLSILQDKVFYKLIQLEEKFGNNRAEYNKQVNQLARDVLLNASEQIEKVIDLNILPKIESDLNYYTKAIKNGEYGFVETFDLEYENISKLLSTQMRGLNNYNIIFVLDKYLERNTYEVRLKMLKNLKDSLVNKQKDYIVLEISLDRLGFLEKQDLQQEFRILGKYISSLFENVLKIDFNIFNSGY